MTTIFPFAPTQQGPFQFQPTLDGTTYTGVVTWNLFGQRYYLSLYALDGTRIFTLPLIGSPLDYDISLTAGYFTSTLVFRQASQQFEVNP
jgi:hypothetical protein